MKYIYCHPLFDERKCSHRFSYYLEKVFREHRLALTRFDYRGTGEADGEFSEVTMDMLRHDLANQIDHEEEISLIGVRFGASLAFDYCCRAMKKVKSLILIEPIIHGPDYIDYLFRKQHIKDLLTGLPSKPLCTESFCNIEGYKTNTRLLEQIRALSLTQIAKDCTAADAIRIVQVSHHSKVNSQSVGFAESLQKTGQTASVEHLNIYPFWERIPLADYTQAATTIWEWCRD
jgi:pimeloyl-ACP methyl ester carboxylesterase